MIYRPGKMITLTGRAVEIRSERRFDHITSTVTFDGPFTMTIVIPDEPTTLGYNHTDDQGRLWVRVKPPRPRQDKDGNEKHWLRADWAIGQGDPWASWTEIHTL